MADALRVLITDGDLDSRVNARKALQRAKLGVAGETGYGTEAVSLALSVHPDAILVAVEEPVGRPLDTAEALLNALPDTPVIIYSSLGDAESVRRGMVFGARDYLVKPLDAAKLGQAVIQALEQEERRQMRRAGQLAGEHGRATVVTITGAKGGIGKSVIAVNLALALRRETGKSVAILDADTEFGDVATMLDLPLDRTLQDLLRRLESVDRFSVRDYVNSHSSGLDVVGSRLDDDPWGDCTAESLRTVIDLLGQVYEFVVIDTSGSFDTLVRTTIDASTLTLLVTSGEVASIRDSGAAMRRVDAWGIPPERVRVILNRMSRGRGVPAGDVGKAIGREIFLELPYDKSVSRSVQLGFPLVLQGGRSAVAGSLTLLARRVAGAGTSPGGTAESTPFWNRVLPRVERKTP